MGNILIICEIIDNKINLLSKEALSLGVQIKDKTNSEINAVILGSVNDEIKNELSKFSITKAYSNDKLGNYNQIEYTEFIKKTFETTNSEIVISGTSQRAREYLPMLSATINANYIAETMAVDFPENKMICKRPIYTGKLFQELAVEKYPVLLALKPKSIEIKEAIETSNVEIVNQEIEKTSDNFKIKDIKKTEGKKADLLTADIVVTGGRGIGSADNFNIINEMSEMLGGAAGATRSIVDAGWIDHSYQVGQTGKIVSPKLYIAAGVSGAIQHVVGMQGSKYIIAINKDPEAPIFKKSDYGVVADMFEFLPALKEEINKYR